MTSERQPLPSAIAFGGLTIREVELDRFEGIAAAGPSRQRICRWPPSRAEADAPSPPQRPAALVGDGRDRFDKCARFFGKCGAEREPMLVGERPGTKVPDRSIRRRFH